jgi:hypothetical protein
MLSNPGIHNIFLDFRAAYDLVDRRLLWDKMQRQFGVPATTIYRISALFDNNSSILLINNHRSTAISNTRGLLQGSSLSPLLFNFFINDMSAELNSLPTVTTYGIKSNNLLFADDANIHANSVDNMRVLLRACERWSEVNHMEFSPSKCIYLGPADPLQGELKMYGAVLPKQDSAIYLGLWFNQVGMDFEQTTSERTNKANGLISMFGDIGMNATGWTFRSSAVAYKSFIRPAMEYGLAIKPFNKEEITPYVKVQNAAMRRILSVPRNTSINAMSKLLLLEPMEFRNNILNAQFVSRLHNAQDGSVPAIKMWWRKIALGKSKKNEPESKSLVQQAVFQNPLWTEIDKVNHLTNCLKHPRVELNPSAQEIANRFIPRRATAAFKTGKKRKLVYDAINNQRGSIASVIRIDETDKYRAICRPTEITRAQRITISRWLTGVVCMHQACAGCEEGAILDRQHGLTCSGAEQFLRNAFPEMEDEFEMTVDNVLDTLLNNIRNSLDTRVNAIAAEAIAMILTKCRQLEQQLDGHWKTTADDDRQAARWLAQEGPGDPFNNVEVVEVANPAQTQQRAALAVARNRMVGRGNSNIRRDEFRPQEGVG